MTRLLKPLFHSPSVLLVPGAVTPPPSCSPRPPLLAQHAPALLPDEPRSVTESFQGDFDPLHCSRTLTSRHPSASHRSAPPSLHSSPHEHSSLAPQPSSSIPSLSSSNHPSSVTPLLVDLSEPQTPSRLPLLSQSESRLQLQLQPAESHFTSRSYPRSLSQPHVQASGTNPREWGEHSAQLSFIDEGRPSV